MSNLDSLQRALRSLDQPDSFPIAPAGLADRALRTATVRRRRNGALITAGAALAAVAVVLTVVLVPGDRKHPATNSGPASGVFAQPRQNVLIIGSDAGPGREGVRPDTIIVASIDTKTGATTMFGLPRVLQHAPFPPGSPAAAAYPSGFYCADHGCLLNGLWTWASGPGKKYYPGDPDPGLTATTQAAEQITGLSVDQTVVVNLRGLQQLVDAVDGVTITVANRIPIAGNSETGCGRGGYIEPGKQKLDGYHALWYVRSRCGSNDYERMGRAQCLLSALAGQADPSTLLKHWPAITGALKGNLKLSIPEDSLSDWATLAGLIRKGGVTTIGLIPDIAPERDDPDYAAIRAQVARSLAGKGQPVAHRNDFSQDFQDQTDAC